MPPARRASAQAEGPPVLLLDATGTLRLAGVAVAGDAAVLAETRRRLDASRGPGAVQLEAAEQLQFARLEAVLGLLRAQGIRELTLVTRPVAAP